MKELKDILTESHIEGYEMTVMVANDPKAKSYHEYNLIGINNAVKDALKYNEDLFFKVKKDGKTSIKQSLKEAIAELS